MGVVFVCPLRMFAEHGIFPIFIRCGTYCAGENSDGLGILAIEYPSCRRLVSGRCRDSLPPLDVVITYTEQASSAQLEVSR